MSQVYCYNYNSSSSSRLQKLEYASVAWNSITSTDANKLERIQQSFATLCFNRFFPQVRYSYSLALV
jgi:hypothetical protein